MKIFRMFLLLAAVSMVASCYSPPSSKKVPRDDPKLHEKGRSFFHTSQLDLMFVIDDSGSMDRHQANLINNLDRFVDQFVGIPFIDYHIGVITTSGEPQRGSRGCCGKLVSDSASRFVDRNTVNGKRELEQNLRVGTNGGTTEMMFQPIWLALTEPNLSQWNKGFYRNDAVLGVIILTDSDDQSRNRRINGPKEIYQFMLGLKHNIKDKLFVTGAIEPSQDTACDISGEPKSVKLEELFSYFGSPQFTLCDTDFGERLAEAGANLLRRLTFIPFDKLPDLDTVKVSYGSQTLPPGGQGWLYDPERNGIHISHNLELKPEPPGTQLKINFEPIR